MSTWFLLGAMSLFVPLIMLIFGIVFLKKSPNKINPVYGYRSRRSMKSIEAWKFAHFLCAKIWLYAGIVMLLLTILAMLLVLNKSEETIGSVAQIVIYVQLAVLLLSIIPVEVALKRNFDENGNKKSPKN
ncbi:MAG: SdpI family protein [Clostridia bacterium]|nr:SdpI family protein [Clostridia bacterium]